MKGHQLFLRSFIVIFLLSLYACKTTASVVEKPQEEKTEDAESGSSAAAISEKPEEKKAPEKTVPDKPESMEKEAEQNVHSETEPGKPEKTGEDKKTVSIETDLKGTETEVKTEVRAEIDPDEIYRQRAAALTKKLSLEEKVGQLLIISLWNTQENGFSRKAGIWEQAQISYVRPGGVLLFGGNLQTEEQVQSLCAGLQQCSEVPLLIATDQEGGYIGRLHESGKIPATRIAAPLDIGRTGDPELAYLAGWITGRECRHLGLNTDFAPVADLLQENSHQVIGSRSFGFDPDNVADMSSAFAKGLRAGGMIPVLKHFPGHGGGGGDPHTGSAVDGRDLDRILGADLLPFSRGIEDGIDCIMLAHVALPEITGDYLPASYSPYIHQELLRKTLGFTGVTVTDSISMGAITTRWALEDSVVQAVRAGVDLILEPPGPQTAFNALLTAVRTGVIPESRIDESVQRILILKLRSGIIEWKNSWGADPSGLVKSGENTKYAHVVDRILPEWSGIDSSKPGSLLHAKLNAVINGKISAAGE